MSSKEFNQPPKKYKQTEKMLTPYQKAQKEWDDRIGSARVQAANWRFFALGALAICVVLSFGLIFQSSKSTVTPYVVQVDKNGVAQTVGPAQEANYKPNDAEIKYFLGQVVQKSRCIPLDPVVAKNNWMQVYGYLEMAAAQKMNKYMRTDNPAGRVGKNTVEVSINVIVQESPNTYQVRWKEDVYTDTGAPVESYNMTGLFTIEFNPPKKQDELLKNPLGLYIKDYNWSREY
jgi:type IV secretion system protein VirB5